MRDPPGPGRDRLDVARLAAVFDAIDDAVVVTDVEDRIVGWNAGAQRLYGYPSGDAIGKRAADLLPQVALVSSAANVTQEILRGNTWSGRVVQRNRSGRPLELDVVVRGLLSEDGRLEGRVAVYRPRRLGIELDAQLLRAERLSGLGTLAAGIGHEFNNLLGGILTNASFLSAHVSHDPELADAIEAIETAARRGAELTRQMLALSGGLPAEHAQADIGSVVRGVVRLVEPQRHTGFVVHVAMPPEPVRVAADPSQLQQVLLHLTLNALDAMRGRGTMSIAVEREQGYARIVVDDEGPGVPEELRDQIFDPFFTTKPRGEATGLGLALVHNVVDRWGGSVEVTDAPERGARFMVRIPLVVQTPAKRKMPSFDPDATGPRRVLVIDDEPGVRAGTARLLRLLGIDAIQAASGAEGLERLRSSEVPIHLVVLDVVMPDLTGDEVYRRLRRDHAALPVLFVSGYPADRLDEVVQGDDHTAFLAKPFDMIALAASLRALLDPDAT